MNTRLKLVLLLLFSSSMILLTNLALLSASAALLASLILAYRVQRAFLPWIKPVFLVFVVITMMHYFTFPPAPMSPAALSWGLIFSLRLFTLISAVFLFVHTTPMSRISEAFSFMPGHLSQVFVLALALVPNIARLAGDIMNSQRSRGVNFRSPRITDTYMPLMVPLFGKTLQKSEKMALAMQARGYAD
jgi:energy-coupling factor transporter transmembrane protein EcfT